MSGGDGLRRLEAVTQAVEGKMTGLGRGALTETWSWAGSKETGGWDRVLRKERFRTETRKQRSLRGHPESLSNSLHSPSGQEAKSPLEETVRHWMPLLITASDPAERKAEGGGRKTRLSQLHPCTGRPLGLTLAKESNPSQQSGEMAQWVKSLTHKCKNRSSDSLNPPKSQAGMRGATYKPSVQETNRHGVPRTSCLDFPKFMSPGFN